MESAERHVFLRSRSLRTFFDGRGGVQKIDFSWIFFANFEVIITLHFSWKVCAVSSSISYVLHSVCKVDTVLDIQTRTPMGPTRLAA